MSGKAARSSSRNAQVLMNDLPVRLTRVASVQTMRHDYGCVGVAYSTAAGPPTDPEGNSMSQARAVHSGRGVQLNVETLLARARQAAGLDDFGDTAFLEPLG